MSKKFDNEIEESVWRAAEKLKIAMMTGDYEKANKLMNILKETKKAAETAIATKGGIMIA